MNILDKLFELKDDKYKEFQSSLLPTVDKNTIIGIRIPKLREYAKYLFKNNNYNEFISKLPHNYYDEYMLHGLIISLINDYDKCINEVNRLLPYINDWAVCDSLNPKIFSKNKDSLLNYIKIWLKSNHPYTIRFAIKMLMTYYIDDNNLANYIDLVLEVKSNEYYVNMMISWYFATILTKRWNDGISYIEEYRLDRWTHNKAIQKARESLAIDKDKKEYLNTLKICNK